MEKEEILKFLHILNEELQRKGIKGELCLFGGAVMCLAFDARPNTQDVDAVFKPTKEIREAAAQIGRDYGLREDWLNDGVKGFLVAHSQKVLLDLSNVKIYIPETDYLLAMKTLAARVDATDKQDVEFLVQLLKINSAEQVFGILEKYYPHQQIKPATKFFIEEIFQQC